MEYIRIILNEKEVGIAVRKGAVVMALGSKKVLEDDIMQDVLYSEITHDEYKTLYNTKYYQEDLFLNVNDSAFSLVTPKLLADLFTAFGTVFGEMQ